MCGWPQGYPGKFYCPRMISMNKPAYAAIQVRAAQPNLHCLLSLLTRCQNYLQELCSRAFCVGLQLKAAVQKARPGASVIR